MAGVWGQKPPDFPTCRLVQETKSIEYNDPLPLPNKTAHNPAPTWLPDFVSTGMGVTEHGVLAYILANLYPAAPDLLSFKSVSS